MVWLLLLVAAANAQSLLPWFSLVPEISRQPQNVAVSETEPFSLRITTTGARSIQWFQRLGPSWVPLAGEDAEVFQVKSATLQHNGEFKATVQGYLGSVDSEVARVTVHEHETHLFIVQQPPNTVVVSSISPQSLVVEAKSSSKITYHWYRDGAPVAEGQTVHLDNLAAAGKTFWKCEICDEHACLTSLTSTVISLNEFYSPWPKQVFSSKLQEKLVLVKGTRPYPDRDDLSVSCQFEQHGLTKAYRADNAFMTYDEHDVPTVFCEFPDSEDAPLGEYILSIRIGSDATVIDDPCIHLFTSKSLSIHGQSEFHADRLVPYFNVSLFGDFGSFTIGQTLDGVIATADFLASKGEPTSTFICVVCSSAELVCTLERKPVLSGRVYLSVNRMQYFDTKHEITIYYDYPGFSEITPRCGPLEGGLEISLEGFSYEYSGQLVTCVFEVPGSGFRHSTPGNVLNDKITCKIPPFPVVATINIFVQFGETTVPVAPVFHYIDYSLFDIYPKFLPVAPSDGVAPPTWLPSRSKTSQFPIVSSEDVLPKPERVLLKLNTFFVYGKGFPVGLIPHVFMGRTPISLVPPDSNCECAVFDPSRLICRMMQDLDVGSNYLFVSFNHFLTWESFPINTFTVAGLSDFSVRPHITSLTRFTNTISLETISVPHGLSSQRVGVSLVRLHIPKLTSRAIPCDVTSSRTISCYIPRASTELTSQSLELFLSVGAASTRYRISSPLQFFKRLSIESIEPRVWHGFGGQHAALTFRQPLPEAQFSVFISGPGIASAVACLDVIRSPVSEVTGSPIPNKLLLTVPPVEGNLANVTLTVFADGANMDVEFELQPIMHNPTADGISPGTFGTEIPTNVCVFGHGFSDELRPTTVLKVMWNPEYVRSFRAVSGNWTHVCFRVSGIVTPTNSFTPALAMLSFDDGKSFWNLKYGTVVLRNIDFSLISIKHSVGTRGDGASILTISDLPNTLLERAEYPMIKLLGLMEGTGRYTSTSQCQTQLSNIVCRLSPLPYPCSLELALDGQDFIAIQHKFLNPTVSAQQ